MGAPNQGTKLASGLLPIKQLTAPPEPACTDGEDGIGAVPSLGDDTLEVLVLHKLVQLDPAICDAERFFD